jgi:hypothetical protein
MALILPASWASTMVADCYGTVVGVNSWPDEASEGFELSLPFAALECSMFEASHRPGVLLLCVTASVH